MTTFLEKLEKCLFMSILDSCCPFLGKNDLLLRKTLNSLKDGRTDNSNFMGPSIYRGPIPHTYWASQGPTSLTKIQAIWASAAHVAGYHLQYLHLACSIFLWFSQNQHLFLSIIVWFLLSIEFIADLNWLKLLQQKYLPKETSFIWTVKIFLRF